MKNSLTQEPPTKVRPSEVDDKVCKGILDEINEASPEPQKVWRAGVLIDRGHPLHDGCDKCHVSEVAAWRWRARSLVSAPSTPWSNTPYEEDLAKALGESKECNHPLVLLDEEGREVRRWQI